MLKTGAVYVDKREAHPPQLLRCTDAGTRRVETMTLWRTSAWGQIESSGILLPDVEEYLREMDTKRKADRLLLGQAEKIQQNGIARSAALFAVLKGT